MHPHTSIIACCAIGALTFTTTATAGDVQTKVFNFANVGQSYSAAIFANDPIVGQQVIGARIYLDISSPPGSDAAFFKTDLALPLIPDPGKTNVVVLSGTSLGWSGEGTFSYFEETDNIQGVFISTGFGGSSSGEGGFFGQILPGSRVEVDYVIPAPGAASLLAGASLIALRRRR